MDTRTRSTLQVVLFLVLISPVARPKPPAGAVYLDPSQPIDVRVDDLIKRMTLEEKASQLVNQARAIPDFRSRRTTGGVRRCMAWPMPARRRCFPNRSDWRPPLMIRSIHEMAVVIGTEARAKHNQAVRAGRRDIMEGLDFWSPNINIFRDPRWGRGQETYGEDPFLTGRMGVAFVTGLQGDDPKYYRVISTPKHFAVHSGPEPSRHTIDVQVSKHDMEDTYLPAFRATVTEGQGGVGDVRLQPRQRPARLRQHIPAARTNCAAPGSSTATSSPTAMPSSTSFTDTTSRRAWPKPPPSR